MLFIFILFLGGIAQAETPPPKPVEVQSMPVPAPYPIPSPAPSPTSTTPPPSSSNPSSPTGTAPVSTTVSTRDKVTISPSQDLSMGVAVQILLPTNMPGFVATTPVYGPQINVPLNGKSDGKMSWVSSATVGGFGSGVYVLLTESAVRFPLPTPFLPFYFFVGAQYMYYVSAPNSYSYAGIHFGPALILPLEKVMDLQLGIKLYLQSQFMTALGGSLIFRL